MKRILLVLTEEEHAVLKDIKGEMKWEEFVLKAAEVFKYGEIKYG